MAIETDADRLAMLDSDEFGSAATYTPAVGSPSTVQCIFDNAFEVVDQASGTMEALGPSALCRTADVSAAKHGDHFAVGGVTYHVTEVQPDGTGMTRLMLSKD